MRDGIIWPQLDSPLKVSDGLRRRALLGGDHTQVVPGFRILGPQFQRRLQIFSRLCRIISAQAQGAQVVPCVGIVGPGGDRLAKTLRRLLRIPVLHHGDSEGERIALKRVLHQHSCKRQSAPPPLLVTHGNCCSVFAYSSRVHLSSQDLHNHSALVNQKRRRQRQVTVAVEQMPKNEVIDTRHLVGRKHLWKCGGLRGLARLSADSVPSTFMPNSSTPLAASFPA